MATKDIMLNTKIANIVKVHRDFVIENYPLSVYLFNKFAQRNTISTSLFTRAELHSFWNEAYLYAVYMWFTREGLTHNYAFGTVVDRCGRTKCYAAMKKANCKKRVAVKAVLSLDEPYYMDEDTVTIGDCLVSEDIYNVDTMTDENYYATMFTCIDNYGVQNLTDTRNLVLHHLLYDKKLFGLREILHVKHQAIYQVAYRLQLMFAREMPNLRKDIENKEIPAELGVYVIPVTSIDYATEHEIVDELRNGKSPTMIAKERNLLFRQVYRIICKYDLETVVVYKNTKY